ncbi:MAG: alpha/beta hydrolase, partial [Sphingopyxis sp.]|nr:alpha/beta hydrolase [Sphingopyxis sp.]
MTARTAKGRRLIKFIIVLVLLLLLFGSGAKMVVAGGAKSLNLADKLLGPDGGARLLIGDQPYGNGPRQSLDIWGPENAKQGDKRPVIVFFYGGGRDSGPRGTYGFPGGALGARGCCRGIPRCRRT